jgi:hypothetical protein
MVDTIAARLSRGNHHGNGWDTGNKLKNAGREVNAMMLKR